MRMHLKSLVGMMSLDPLNAVHVKLDAQKFILYCPPPLPFPHSLLSLDFYLPPSSLFLVCIA